MCEKHFSFDNITPNDTCHQTKSDNSVNQIIITKGAFFEYASYYETLSPKKFIHPFLIVQGIMRVFESYHKHQSQFEAIKAELVATF